MAKGNANGEHALQEKVSTLIRTGHLPARRPDRIWGGPGVGAECAICGARITEDDVEMEVEFLAPDGLGADRYHLHVRCYAVLEDQSRNLRALGGPAGPARPPAGSGPDGNVLTLHSKA